MTTYLTISVGPTPATARPLLASTDSDIVRDTVRAIMGKVETSSHEGGEEPERTRAGPQLARVQP